MRLSNVILVMSELNSDQIEPPSMTKQSFTGNTRPFKTCFDFSASSSHLKSVPKIPEDGKEGAWKHEAFLLFHVQVDRTWLVNSTSMKAQKDTFSTTQVPDFFDDSKEQVSKFGVAIL